MFNEKKTLFSCLKWTVHKLQSPASVQMNRWKLLFSFLTASELLTAKVRTDVNVSKFSSLKPISNLILESFVVCSFAQMFFLHFTNTNCLKVPEMFPTISIYSVPTGHLLQFLNLSGSPLVCHPGAVKPSLQPKSLPLSVNKLWEGVILEQTNEGPSPLPRCELFLSADKMWVLSCHYRVLAAGLLSFRPDILNPDAIWRPGHFNSQETCTFFNSFFWDTRGTAHTLKAFMHQKPLTFMHYIHKDENFTHGVLTAIEGRLVHEMRGNIGRKLHCSATNTGTTAGSHQFNLSGQHDVTWFPQTFFSTFAIYMLIRSMRCFF